MGIGKVLAATAIGLGVLGGIGFVVYKSPVGQQFVNRTNQDEAGTPVIMESITFGDLERTVSAPGSIEPKRLINISSQVSAKVLALPFEEGDQVKEGDVVIRLDPQDLVAALDSAKAGLAGQEASLGGAEAALINARLSYERLQQLNETGDATKAELEKLGARVDVFDHESRDAGPDEGITIHPPSAGIDRADTAPPIEFDTYDDHRMAMSMSLIALRRPNVLIRDPGCVAKTYPTYWQDFARLYTSQ